MKIKVRKYFLRFGEALASLIVGAFVFWVWDQQYCQMVRNDRLSRIFAVNQINHNRSCQLEPHHPLLQQHLLNINHKKFLLPLLVNGPNNQLIGFRDAVFLSIILNRTLVVPRFYEHKTDQPVEADLRVDLQVLSKLIPLESASRINELCRGGIGALFLTNKSSWIRKKEQPYHRLADLTGVSSLHRVSRNNISFYPVNDSMLFNVHSSIQMKQLYSSEEECALYIHPFRSVGVRESASGIRKARKLLESGSVPPLDEPTLLYSLGYVTTPMPAFLFKIAEDFRKNVFRHQNLIAVHWRYDRQDWMVRCSKQTRGHGGREMYEMCGKLRLVGPEDIAEGISQFRRGLAESGVSVEKVYIAAPQTLRWFVKVIKYHLVASDMQVYTHSDARAHLEQYSDCSFISRHFYDLLSLLEMNICLHSCCFLSSGASSWSSNVNRDRIANKWNAHDDVILDIAWRAHQLKTIRIFSN